MFRSPNSFRDNFFFSEIILFASVLLETENNSYRDISFRDNYFRDNSFRMSSSRDGQILPERNF